MQFLETIVGDPGFTQYTSVPHPQLQQQHKADLNKLVYGEFEKQKNIFGDDVEENRLPAVVTIPNSFMKFYNPGKLEAAINSLYKDVAELDASELTIEPPKMKEFFEEAIKQICRYAFLALESCSRGKEPRGDLSCWRF